jgi:hypothetical protein
MLGWMGKSREEILSPMTASAHGNLSDRMRVNRINALLTLSACLTLGFSQISWASPHGSHSSASIDPDAIDTKSWASKFTGRRYYLRARQGGLLTNDQVEIQRCVISYAPTWIVETQEKIVAYDASFWMQGVSPAPPASRRISVHKVKDAPDLDKVVANLLSLTPLEDEYPWQAEVKLAVRYRYVALGMNKEMVALALGGLPYQVDLEKLDDGRVRETWKLQVTGDTRRIFSERSTYLNTITATSGQVIGTIGTVGQILGASSTTTSRVDVRGSEAGAFVFAGSPPQFLNIAFTDGQVTSRRTELVK